MRSRFLLVALCFIHTNALLGQFPQPKTFKNIVVPSPNAAVFDKFGNVPVSTYSGIPNIQIPIYTIENKDIKVPLSISYHAGGIKVEEESSRVGLGWVINAGGIINRSVNGNDDFKPVYGYLNNTFPEFYSDQATEILRRSNNVVNSDIATSICFRNILGNQFDLSSYLPGVSEQENYYMDMEPDVFTYNFLGYQGKFVLRKNKEVIKEKPDALEIKLLDTLGTKWQITTPDGIRFIFAETEDCSFLQSGADPVRYITSWYLTKIISLSKAEIDFFYTKDASNAVRSLNSIREKYILGAATLLTTGAPQCASLPGTNSRSYAPIRQYPLVYLDSITYPAGTASFEYESRIDIKNDKRLTGIKVRNKYSSAGNRFFKFVQDYFTRNITTTTIPDPEVIDQNLFDKRLKLTSVLVQNAGEIAIQRYNFIYNEQNLPSKKSFARDHWGFFNGAALNNTFLPKITVPNPFDPSQVITYSNGANREPDSAYSQAFMLKEIQYPTGGKTLFEYEPNEFDPLNSGGGPSTPTSEKVTETKDFFTRRGVDETFNITFPARFNNQNIFFEITSENGQSNGGTPTYPQDAFIEIYPVGSTTPIHRTLLGYESFWQSTGSFKYKRTDQFNFPAGDYVIKTHFGSNVMFLNYIQFKFTYTYEKQNIPVHDIKLGGGLRIAKISEQETVASKNNVRMFNYRYLFDYDNDGVPEENSYGRSLSAVKYANHEYVAGCNQDVSLCDVFNLYSDSYISQEEAFVGYDMVTVYHGANGENGKEEFLYENKPAQELTYMFGAEFDWVSRNVRPSGVRNLVHLQNGSLLKSVAYQYNSSLSQYRKVRELTNSYKSTPEQTMLGIRIVGLGAKPTSCMWDNCGWLLVQYPVLQSGWTYLDSTTVRQYDSFDGTLEHQQLTRYKHETLPARHYQPIGILTDDSKTGVSHDYFVYPSDYSTGTSFIDSMKIHNIVAPVENVRIKEDNSGNKSIVSGLITKYYPSNPSLTESVSSIEMNRPIPLGEFKFSNRSLGVLPTEGSKTAFSQAGTYKQQITFNKYDIYCNLAEQTKINDIKKTYVWDYLGSYPIAEVINGDSSDIAFTSFEADSKGNWSFSGPSVADITAVTGRKSYNVAGGTIGKASLQSGKTYTLSYWTKNGIPYNIVGTLASYPVKGKTINGWTYYEHKISGITNISISGSGYIDELRLYPSTAQMTTYTFYPHIGMTSQCDAQGRISYYLYDDLGRLKGVKDQDGNILKQYDYQYQQPVTQ